MHNWEGSRVRAEAQQVPCRYCLAVAGKPCVQKGSQTAIEAFPAHTVRISDAQKAIEA